MISMVRVNRCSALPLQLLESDKYFQLHHPHPTPAGVYLCGLQSCNVAKSLALKEIRYGSIYGIRLALALEPTAKRHMLIWPGHRARPILTTRHCKPRCHLRQHLAVLASVATERWASLDSPLHFTLLHFPRWHRQDSMATHQTAA